MKRGIVTFAALLFALTVIIKRNYINKISSGIKTVKPIVFFYLLLLVTSNTFSQQISIQNRIFRVGEPILEAISQYVGSVVFENDIKRVSENITVNGTSNYQCGSQSTPGQYLLKFKSQDGVERTFLVFVLPGSFSYSVNDLVKEVRLSNGITKKYIDNLVAFTGTKWKDINGQEFNRYLTSHVISTTTSFLICVTAIAEPKLWIQCGSNVAGNAKDYTLILLEEAGVKFVAKGSLTAAEFQRIKTAIAATDFAFFLLQGFRIKDGKIKLNNVEILTDAANFVSDTSTQNETSKTCTTISTEFTKKLIYL